MYTYTHERRHQRSPGFQEIGGALDELTTSLGDAVDTFLGSLGGGSMTYAPRRLGPHQSRPSRRYREDRGYREPQDHRHHDECHEHHECASCGSDSCHCRCCIADADLLIYSRLFELRVIPIRIENRRKRAREITVELSEFRRSGGGDAPVRGALATSTSFTLEACNHEEVILVVGTGGVDEKEKAGLAAMMDVVAKRKESDREIPDVDDCVVAYADLRVEGCDIRPIRIAVALLPRDCGAYEIECACSCC